MIKKLLCVSLFIIPSFAMAQSEWEVPTTAKPGTTKEQKDNKSDKTTQDKKTLDPKYGVGAVPLVDGKVVFTTTVKVPGASADVLYDRALAAVNELLLQPNQHELSRISVVNKTDHVIAASLDEDMEFSTKMLSHDFTDFRYTLILKCSNGSVEIEMSRLSYDYDKERPSHTTYSAEEWITDKEALNKKGTKIYRTNGKFRTHTIDRKDELFAFFTEKIKVGSIN